MTQSQLVFGTPYELNSSQGDQAMITGQHSVHTRRAAPTPEILKLALAVSVGLTILLSLIVFCGWQQQENAVKTLGIDAAPSVVAAHRIKIYIESLDADLCNELLLPPASSSEWVKDFDRARAEIGSNLIAAAKNITYGDAELIPIQTIQEGLGGFLMSAQAARDEHNRGNNAGMLECYRRNYRILKRDLIPAADTLNQANNKVLQQTYQNQKRIGGITGFIVFTAGSALIVLLIIVQLYLRRRFRRQLNVCLLAATIFSIMFVWFTQQAFSENAKHMKGIKEDSYDSVLALLDARADAYEANAAESRWLLDRQNREEHSKTFLDFTFRLVKFSGNQTFEGCVKTGLQRNRQMGGYLKSGLSAVQAGAEVRRQFPYSNFDGALRNALDNITFPDPDPLKDEPTQSVETLRTFGVYYKLDERIRALENSGQHNKAVDFCMSMKPGDSNWAFFQFDQSLERWLKINEQWMKMYTDKAFGDIQHFPIITPVFATLVAVLIFFGLIPRINEYK